MTCRLLLLSVFVPTLGTACKPSDSTPRDSARLASTPAAISRKTSNSGQASHYELVVLNGRPLPETETDGEPPNTCDIVTFSQSYDISRTAWRGREEYSSTCPVTTTKGARVIKADSGTIRRLADTLHFYRSRPDGSEMEVERGWFRGDTLQAAGEDWGPTRLFVLRPAP